MLVVYGKREAAQATWSNNKPAAIYLVRGFLCGKCVRHFIISNVNDLGNDDHVCLFVNDVAHARKLQVLHFLYVQPFQAATT